MKVKTASITAAGRALSRGATGQAMVEYAIISAAILVGTVTLHQFFLPLLMDAYQFYFDVFFFMLNLPVP